MIERDAESASVISPLTGDELARLPIFPLPHSALFPGTPLPLHVFEPRYRAMVRDALAGNRALAVARLKPGFEADYDGRPPVFEVCGAGRIVDHVRLEDGRYHLVLQGLARVRILDELPPSETYRVVRAEPIADLPADARLCSALETKIRSLWQALARTLPADVRNLAEVTRDADCAAAFSDRLGALLAGDADIAQLLLAEPDPCLRLELVAERLETMVEAMAPSSRSTLN